MRSAHLFTFLAFTLGTASLVGCGGDDAAAAKAASGNLSAARNRFNGGPTASLDGTTGTRALKETKSQQASGDSAMKANPLSGGGSGSVDPQSARSLGLRSVRALAEDTAIAKCADIEAGKDSGSCDCPGGGSLSYDVPNLKKMMSQEKPEGEVSVAFAYDQCVLDGTTHDGSLSMLLSDKSVVKVPEAKSSSDEASEEASTAAVSTGMNMLVVADGLKVGDETLDFAFAFDQGRFFYAPEVDDKGGYVLTELDLTGSAASTVVHAKNGTFTCDESTGKCTSEDGKEIELEGGATAPSDEEPTDEEPTDEEPADEEPADEELDF